MAVKKDRLVEQATVALDSFAEHARSAAQLATKFLKTLSITQEDVARRVRISHQYFAMMLCGSKPLRPEHAMRLLELAVVEINQQGKLTWEQAGLLIDCVEAWSAAIRAWAAAVHGPAVQIAERTQALPEKLSAEDAGFLMQGVAMVEGLFNAGLEAGKIRNGWLALRDVLVKAMLTAKPELRPIYEAVLAGIPTSATSASHRPTETPKRRRGRPRTRALPQHLRV